MAKLRIRLYEGALVELEGHRGPFSVAQLPHDPTGFVIAGFVYDVCGRAALPRTRVPKILMVYSTGCQLLKRA